VLTAANGSFPASGTSIRPDRNRHTHEPCHAFRSRATTSPSWSSRE